MASKEEEDLFLKESNNQSQRMRGIGPISFSPIKEIKTKFQFESGGRHKCKTLGLGSWARDHGGFSFLASSLSSKFSDEEQADIRVEQREVWEEWMDQCK